MGSNSAMPTHGRNQSAQLLCIKGELLLFDCGEATQIQLQLHKAPTSKISKIFISHMHGDHYFGLPGLLFTFHLLRRKDPLEVYCPPGLRDILLLQFKYSHTSFSFPLELIEWKPDKVGILCETAQYRVDAFPVNHRIPCMGFKVTAFPIPEFRIKKEGLPHWLDKEHFKLLQQGKDITDPSGKTTYPNHYFTQPPHPPAVFSYCTDTLYTPEILPIIRHSDILYHEATFMHDKLDRAKATFHTTAKQAAQMAKDAEVSKLIIGHFSTRYRKLDPLLAEAKLTFPNTFLAIEGTKFELKPKEV